MTLRDRFLGILRNSTDLTPEQRVKVADLLVTAVMISRALNEEDE